MCIRHYSLEDCFPFWCSLKGRGGLSEQSFAAKGKSMEYGLVNHFRTMIPRFKIWVKIILMAALHSIANLFFGQR